MATSRSGTDDGHATRLGVDDWVRAGFAVLAEQGIKALKVDVLCSHLGVTKGSFYWHFDGMPAYRAALIDAWGTLRDGDRRDFDDMTGVAPREQLSRMMTSLVSPRHWMLERAMREWARSDDAVAASVRDADRRVLRAVRRAFVAYGFDADEAGLRADATFAAGIGFLHLSGPVPPAQDAARIDRFLELMLAR
ncbi:TetR/AcrR family transcriptional regulator [Mycolicibacterium sediminis]|uniref:TetR family transcriptional regulator n=1 Tax=Mycolicibacterium sediminis TaxID=1286180 RepID=A0A7I7QRB0_9MYCO|nr:TetR/AcrR family transcriptional regulator [Mycolicibacterium sediminis]BBY28854.1 TetR family transcriptional regulator [Mycolicibacterium sediminis]